jgi:hypothetical protein
VNKTKLAATVMSVAVIAGVSACSSSSSGGAANPNPANATAVADSSAQAVAAAKQLFAGLSPSTFNNKILVKTPLTARPPTGKVVYWLQPNIPQAALITPGMQAATKALGWTLKIITFDLTDPNGANQAMQQAVTGSPKPDFIALPAISISQMGAGLAAAKAANIPVIEDAGDDTPEGQANGIYGNPEGVAWEENETKAISAYVIADSNATAHVLVVNIPSSPILAAADKAIDQEYATCPDCKVSKLNASFTDAANGAIASQVVSRIQADPSIDYVQTTVGDFVGNLPAALQAAGLKTKIVGAAGEIPNLQSVAGGTSQAFLVQGTAEAAFVMIDTMCRIAVGDPLLQSEHNITLQLWTTQDIPKPIALYAGPKNYQAQYEALWHVS